MWRHVMTANGGLESAFPGEFREIVPNERTVSTEVFEGTPDAEAVTTTPYTEEDGRTTLTVFVQHRNSDARDMHLNDGMEGGKREALDPSRTLPVHFVEEVVNDALIRAAPGHRARWRVPLPSDVRTDASATLTCAELAGYLLTNREFMAPAVEAAIAALDLRPGSRTLDAGTVAGGAQPEWTLQEAANANFDGIRALTGQRASWVVPAESMGWATLATSRS